MSRRLITVVVALVTAAASLAACSSGGGGGYHVSADFTQGIGLYPGSPVRVLGIKIGRITDVTNRGTLVRVDMH
ncbi:MAG: MCE family protein, partial [Actinobacteria bacterium]|nr:MCE family protein [Actinomycetota bacterium]